MGTRRARTARASPLELFAERGVEQTTVEEIESRAGLTQRTFFRHFSDKREVLFAGGDEFRAMSWKASPRRRRARARSRRSRRASTRSRCGFFADRGAFARRRQAVSVANPELQERELVKLASVAAALAGALRERGVGEPEASVTAEAGVAVFRVSFERWVGEDEPRARGADPRVRRRAAVGQYSTPSAELRNAM